MYSLFDWGFYSEGGITSPDFKCKPFDAGANGFAQGEGVVVVVLKKLEAALSDNDHIYSVVSSSQPLDVDICSCVVLSSLDLRLTQMVAELRCMHPQP